MATNPVGTMFVELDMDSTKYTRAQKDILKSANSSSLEIETNFKRIGGTSDAMFTAMRQSAENAHAGIVNSSKSSSEEILRANEALHAKITSINQQQFGVQTTLLDSMKKNWVASAAIVTAAWMAVNKAMDWAQLGAKAMQAEESFRIVSASAGENADKILAGMKRASAGTVEESDIMQKAVKGMVLGLKGDEMVHIMDAARVSARVAGEDVLTAYEGITDAIATQMPKALKRYGLITMDEMALVKKAMKEGIEDVNLYQLAMLNAGIQAEKMGQMHRNAAENIQAFHAQIKEMGESFGKLYISTGKYLMAAWKELWGFIIRAAQGMATVLSILPGSFGEAGKKAAEELKKWSEFAQKEQDALLGKKTDAEKKETEEAAKGAAARIAAAEKEKTAWKAALEARLGAAKLAKEIQAAEEHIAAVVEGIRKKVEKDQMDALKFNREEANRLFNEQEKGMKEYEKIVTEANDWSVSEHQKAINQILSSEATKVARMYELWEAGSINIAQLDAGLAAVRAASAIATASQVQKQMTDEANFYSQLTDYAGTYYEKKLALIEKERSANALLYGEKAAQAKAELDIAKVAATKWDMENAGALSMISNTGKLLDSTMGMFKKESSEYKALMKLKEISHVAELGMNVAKAVSAFAVATAQNAANVSVATTGAAASVAAQGSVPVAGFALAAAMAAFMASILAASGIAWGGGSAGAAAAPVLPASDVLGAEPGTGSNSAQKTWELMKDTYTLEYRELTGIHDSMKELNQNITGLVSGIARSFDFSTSGGSILEQVIWGGYESRGTQSYTWPVGIDFGSVSVANLQAGGGVPAQKYAAPGGSLGTSFLPLERDVANLLTRVYESMGDNLLELARGFGEDTAATLAYVFEAERLNLQGLTGEEITKAVNEFLSDQMHHAVDTLFGDLVKGYQQLDEDLYQTAVRLTIDKAVIMDTLTMTGQAFTGTIPQIIAFSESIIAMAGDLDTLRKSAETYYDKFFTDAEKQARLQVQLSGALGDIGYALPGSRGGYRALVEGLDLTTTAGQQAYVMLMNFADAADQYYSVLEDIVPLTDKLTESLKKQAETITKWLADLNKSTLAPVMSARAQEEAYAAARGAAFAPGAAEAQTSAFLTAASDYLKFARAYSGDYASVYQAVTGDVQGLAAAIALALAQSTLPAHAGGGLTRGPTVTGEIGREWNVPTYEPQRSRFLESAPPQFWENLRGAGVVQPGGGGDITIRLVNVLDGKTLTDTIAKHIPRNANMAEAIRRVN